jgi:hypothetical protein
MGSYTERGSLATYLCDMGHNYSYTRTEARYGTLREDILVHE